MRDPQQARGDHVHAVVVRWGDCDPAGIVYYPRFFDYFHQTMEAWFESELGLPYRDLIVGRKLGFPSVHTEADFRVPSVFGDRLEIRLRVADIGRTSLRFDYRVSDSDAVTRVTGSTTCVVMDLDETHETYRRAVPIPVDLRALIERHRDP